MLRKRDNSEEEFCEWKLSASIEKACGNKSIADEIAKSVYEKNPKTTIEVEELVESKMQEMSYENPEMLSSLNKYTMGSLLHVAGREYSEPAIAMGTVVKRSGLKEDFILSKIVKKAKMATSGLSGVNYAELVLDSQLKWHIGITTGEIQEELRKTADSKVSEVYPNWTFVAARIFLERLYHQVGKVYGNKKGKKYPTLKQYSEFVRKTDKFADDFWDLFDIDMLNEHIVESRDLQFTHAGITMFYSRYIETYNDEPIELPQLVFMAVAMFLAQKEKEPNKWAIKFYNQMSTMVAMMATPTLSNARKKKHQLSSCFVGGNDDSLIGIFDGYKEKAMLSKLGGGIGWDWSMVRCYGSEIDGHDGAAHGVVPFVKIDNDVANAVDQLGTRKGAIAEYMPDWHIDFFDFLKMRENGGDERKRAQDIFPALWASDEFMRREQNDEMWSMFDPFEVPELNNLYGDAFTKAYREAEKNPNIKKKRVKARELFAAVVQAAFKHGVPFVCFKDTANESHKNKHTGMIRSSNLCTEIFQTTSPDRTVYELTLYDGEKKFKIEVDEFDYITTSYGKKRAKNIAQGDMIDDRQVIDVVEKRVEGSTAICNLASVNLAKCSKLSDDEYFDVVYTTMRALDNVIDCNLYPTDKIRKTAEFTRAVGLGVMGEHEAIANLGIHFGSDEHLEWIDREYERFTRFSRIASEKLAEERGACPASIGSSWEKPMRNAYINAIAPTSSISILCGTTQCIEPIYKRFWYEENLVGQIACTAPGINIENYEFYRPAHAVNQEKLVRANAVRSKYVDQGISMNIFVNPVKVEYILDVVKLYRLAWLGGSKSVYYLRSQAPSEINEVIDRSMECSGCQ